MADQFTLQHGGSDQFLEQWGIVPQPAIPTPESTDNGKVLGVSDGAYALVSGGGGGGESNVVVTPLYIEDVPGEEPMAHYYTSLSANTLDTNTGKVFILHYVEDHQEEGYSITDFVYTGKEASEGGIPVYNFTTFISADYILLSPSESGGLESYVPVGG